MFKILSIGKQVVRLLLKFAKQQHWAYNNTIYSFQILNHCQQRSFSIWLIAFINSITRRNYYHPKQNENYTKLAAKSKHNVRYSRYYYNYNISVSKRKKPKKQTNTTTNNSPTKVVNERERGFKHCIICHIIDGLNVFKAGGPDRCSLSIDNQPSPRRGHSLRL